MIEIFHILTNEITVNDLTKILLLNKFKKFVELIRVSKIEISSNSKISDNETSNSKFNNNKTSNKNKNNENFVTNYYKKAGKEAGKEADKEADEEVSFKTEEAE